MSTTSQKSYKKLYEDSSASVMNINESAATPLDKNAGPEVTKLADARASAPVASTGGEILKKNSDRSQSKLSSNKRGSSKGSVRSKKSKEAVETDIHV